MPTNGQQHGEWSPPLVGRRARGMVANMRATHLLAAALLVLSACAPSNLEYDFDGDGWDDADDCGPEDPLVNPDAPDPYGDGEDTNCDGLDGLDADGDGFPGNEDLSDQENLWDCRG